MHESDRSSPRTYERMLDPEPEFLGKRVDALEAGAASGELTGGKEMHFMAGIELEFGLYSPERFRAALADEDPDLKYHSESSKQTAIESILQVDQIATLEYRHMSDDEKETERYP